MEKDRNHSRANILIGLIHQASRNGAISKSINHGIPDEDKVKLNEYTEAISKLLGVDYDYIKDNI